MGDLFNRGRLDSCCRKSDRDSDDSGSNISLPNHWVSFELEGQFRANRLGAQRAVVFCNVQEVSADG